MTCLLQISALRQAMHTIAIETSNLARPDKTGVAVYGTNLIRSLADLDRENRYILCYRLSRIRKRRYLPVIRDKRFRKKIIQEPLNRLFIRQVDLYHGLDARVYGSGRTKRVVTIHDVLHYTEAFPVSPCPESRVRRYRAMLANVDRIIAVSMFTKRELIRYFPLEAEKIDVVHHGVADRFRPRETGETRSVLNRYGIRGPYLLFVGCIEARKNLGRLLEAFAVLDSGCYEDLQLVLAGNPGEGSETIYRALSRLRLEHKVRLIGYVEEDILPFLYAGAEIFLFPSLYEGFGLPVLEAMACGTPVITSNATALPEVAGDAALLVDPDRVQEICSAVKALLCSSSLRQAYREKGLKRARTFTWEDAARNTLSIYRNVMENESRKKRNVKEPSPACPS